MLELERAWPLRTSRVLEAGEGHCPGMPRGRGDASVTCGAPGAVSLEKLDESIEAEEP